MVPQDAGKLLSVGAVFVNAEFDVLGKLFVELLKGVLVFNNFFNELETFLDQILSDDLEDLVLLKHLTRNVERQVFRVYNTLDEVEVLGDQLLTAVHDEDSPDIELDVVLLLLVFKQVKGGSLRNEEESFELQLAFDREVLDGQMFLPVVGE